MDRDIKFNHGDICFAIFDENILKHSLKFIGLSSNNAADAILEKVTLKNNKCSAVETCYIQVRNLVLASKVSANEVTFNLKQKMIKLDLAAEKNKSKPEHYYRTEINKLNEEQNCLLRTQYKLLH